MAPPLLPERLPPSAKEGIAWLSAILYNERHEVIIGNAMEAKKEMTLKEVKEGIAELSRAELERLDKWIHARMLRLEKQEAKSAEKRRREILREEKRGSWVYQQVAVRCGKAGCKCNEGQPHGAYWYAYRREGRKVVSKYIGKELRELDE